MKESMTLDARYFYRDYFDRYAKYFEPLACKVTPKAVENPRIYEKFEGAMLDNYPSPVYKWVSCNDYICLFFSFLFIAFLFSFLFFFWFFLSFWFNAFQAYRLTMFYSLFEKVERDARPLLRRNYLIIDTSERCWFRRKMGLNGVGRGREDTRLEVNNESILFS